jgi:uncharacterized membrane protein (Fun14 family)
MKLLKIASLIVGILLMILAGIGFVVSLLLPTITDNHVSFEESMIGLIPSAIVFIFAFLLTLISAFFVFKRKKTVV